MTKVGFSTPDRARRSAHYSPEDGDRLIQLQDGSWAVLGTPGYDPQGRPVQYLAIPRRRVSWQAAVRQGWVL